MIIAERAWVEGGQSVAQDGGRREQGRRAVDLLGSGWFSGAKVKGSAQVRVSQQTDVETLQKMLR